MRARFINTSGTSGTSGKEETALEEQRPPLAEAAALCVMTVVLVCFGMTMLYSTSFGIAKSAYGLAGSSLFVKQLQWAIVGTLGFFTVIAIGYKRLSDKGWWLLGGVCLMLCLALCFPAIKGARRWITVPGIGNIQPSEFAKVILALFLAKLCSEKLKVLETKPWKFFFITAGVPTMFMILLVFTGKDLGTSVLLAIIFFSILFAAGIRLICLLPWPIVLPPLGYILIKNFSPYRWDRLTSYVNPEAVSEKTGYQLWLSILALGSGSWTGLGFTESRLKHRYLPEAHTDFILSIVGEELGYVTMCGIIVFYLIYVFLAIRISMKARTRQGMLLSFGLATFIAVQAIINIGVISGAFPTKGMPAPFISYGGSSLVTCLVATGLIVSVALDAAYPEYYKTLTARVIAFCKAHNPLARKEPENP